MKKTAMLGFLIFGLVSFGSVRGQDLPFDFQTKFWAPRVEGKFGSVQVQEESSLSPSFSLGGIVGRHYVYGESRLGVRYEEASFDSDLTVRNAYFDWDGLHFGSEDLGLTLGGSLRYSQVTASLPTLSGSVSQTVDSLFPEIRLKGHWKLHPSFSLEALVEQGLPFDNQNATTLEASARWKISRGASLVAGYRKELLEIQDLGSSDTRADLRMGGPFLAMELRF